MIIYTFVFATQSRIPICPKYSFANLVAMMVEVKVRRLC